MARHAETRISNLRYEISNFKSSNRKSPKRRTGLPA